MYQHASDPDSDPITDPIAIAVASTSEASPSDRAALPGPRLHSAEGDITPVLMRMVDLTVLSPRGALLVAWARRWWPEAYGAYFNAHARPRIVWNRADWDAYAWSGTHAQSEHDTTPSIPAYRLHALDALMALRSKPTTRLTDANRWKDTPPYLPTPSAPSQREERREEPSPAAGYGAEPPLHLLDLLLIWGVALLFGGFFALLFWLVFFSGGLPY